MIALFLSFAFIASVLPVAGAAPAEQVHVSWLGDGWAVTFTQPSPADQPPEVAWTSGDGESGVAPVAQRPRTVHDGDMERAIAGRTGTTAWTAPLPASATSYTIGDRAFDLVRVPRGNDSVRVVFIADHSVTENSRAIVDLILSLDASLVLIGGDLAYGNEDLSRWDDWFDMIEPSASRVPWMPAPGNHDLECFSSGLNDVNGIPTSTPRSCADGGFYRDRFVLPNGDTRYYTFDWGPLSLISLDTMAYHPEGSAVEVPTDPVAQRAFLAETLASKTDKWTATFFHHAMFSSNEAHGPDAAVAADLGPVFASGGADLVLAGHDHHYERSWPLTTGGEVAVSTNTSLEGDGTVYIVGGGGGRGLYKRFAEPQPAWSAFRNATFQLVVFDVTPARIDAQAIRLDGSVLDTFSIVRPGAVAAPAADAPETGIPGPGLSTLIAAVALMGIALRRRP